MADPLHQGDPDSLICRHCKCAKQDGPRGGRFCETCDGPALKLARSKP